VKRVGLSMAPEFRSHPANGCLDSPSAKRWRIVFSVDVAPCEVSLSQCLCECNGDGDMFGGVDASKEGIVDDVDGREEGVPSTPCSVAFLEAVFVGRVQNSCPVRSVDQSQEAIDTGTGCRRMLGGTWLGYEERR
jgi:hypothetical protein